MIIKHIFKIGKSSVYLRQVNSALSCFADLENSLFIKLLYDDKTANLTG